MMMHDRREAKRARQACLNCRRKKARCSGEKPVCAFCARLKQPCDWDHASPEVDRLSRRSVSHDTGLVARVALLEAKLNLINDDNAFLGPVDRTPSGALDHPAGACRENHSSRSASGCGLSPLAEDDFSVLPDKNIFRGLIDVYFQLCHNQPYAYFHEATFRRSFEEDSLPEYLLFAFAATACRFSHDTFYLGRQLEAITLYTNASWRQIFEDSFSYEGSLEFCMVQATSMLAAIDFTSGHTKLGWVKFSLTIRFAQGLRLNEEPDEQLPAVEQEVWRRTFWSVYVLDALISLGPNRPRSFLDADCTVRLPCHEDLFRNALISDSEPTLEAVLEEPTAPSHQNLDYFALTVLMASALGRFIRLALKRSPRSPHVPWDPRSQYHDVHVILLHFEALSPCTLSTLTETLQYQFTFDGCVDQPRSGHFLYSHAMFHMLHCLLNHPFILHHILLPCPAPVPPSFVSEALQRCHKHANELLDLLIEAQNYGGLVQSSFYGYCVMTSGIIHRLYESHEIAAISAASKERSSMALGFLEAQPVRWPIFGHMAMSLRYFKPGLDTARALTDPVTLSQKTPIKDADTLWQLLDYARMPEINPLLSQRRTTTPEVESRRRTLSARGPLPREVSNTTDTAPLTSSFEDLGPEVFGDPLSMNHMWSPFLRETNHGTVDQSGMIQSTL